MYNSVPIIHSQSKLYKNSFVFSSCLCTVNDCSFCCSQNAICIICRAVNCGLCCPLCERETSCVVLQEKSGRRVFERRVQGWYLGVRRGEQQETGGS
jgi:hypothetical protein